MPSGVRFPYQGALKCYGSVMFQNDAFLEGEGNHWLKRNPVNMSSTSEEMDDISLIVAVLKSDSDRIENILEVGSSSGQKLNSLCRNFGASGMGIDPSEAAVKQGTSQVGRNYSENLRFVRGVASQIPCPSNSFDLVVMGFFLYIEDRSKLLQSLCEADRVLKPGGYLVVKDFLTETPHRRPYAHHDGLFSYKNDYMSFFLALNHYSLVASIPLNRNQRLGFEQNPNLREVLSICVKKEEPYPLFRDGIP